MNRLLQKIIYLFFVVASLVEVEASPQAIQLFSERHRTEWNWIEYRLILKNGSSFPVLNPEIRYFANDEFEKDSLLAIAIDYHSYLYPVKSFVKKNYPYLTISFKIEGLLFAQDSIEIHFRMYHKNWASVDFSKDWSFQSAEGKKELHYFIAVYDSNNNLLWGGNPITGESVSDVVLWQDRKNAVIPFYKEDSSKVVHPGRFWLLKDSPLSKKERTLLEMKKMSVLNGGRYQKKNFYLMTTPDLIEKRTLDSILSKFYNAISVDDTTSLDLNLSTENFADSLDIVAKCWPDISINDCIESIKVCEIIRLRLDRGLIFAPLRQNSISCLERNRFLEFLEIKREGKPANDAGRNAVNISPLQNDLLWRKALSAAQPSNDWLSDAEYTGKNVVVGVYDQGIYYGHASFNEFAQNGIKPRIYKEGQEHFGEHGTHVAGIIGGNGWNPERKGPYVENFEYRGVAPKVLFYSDIMSIENQIGNIVNHSHIDLGPVGFYCSDAYFTDKNLFENWKNADSTNDSLSKTSVYAAGNNGGTVHQYGKNIGYHSILANSKNSITVGNFSSFTGLRESHSSMGPTWDGRIKPDVMAPGSSVQYSFSAENPLRINLKRIQVYDGKTKKLKFNMTFDLKNWKPSGYYASTGFKIFQEKNENVFQIVEDRILDESGNRPSESFYNWKIGDFDGKDSIYVERGDSIVVEAKYVSGNLVKPLIKSVLYFGNINKSFLMNFANEKGSFSLDYLKTSFTWNGLSVNTKNIQLNLVYDLGVFSSVPCDEKGGSCYREMAGTSMSAPYVSGIAALMYQRFSILTGKSLVEKSLRNSTVKAILIHSASDMEDSDEAHFDSNPDITAAMHDGTVYYTPYGKGPDFATGWGRVDAKSALDVINDYDSAKKEFRRIREFSLGNGKEMHWTFNVPAGMPKIRQTLVWDDAPGLSQNANRKMYLSPKLVNDLDLYLISPSGKFYFPWKLEPLPTDNIDISGAVIEDASRKSGLENIREASVKNAYRDCGKNNSLDYECFDHLNNVEVVDVESPEAGIWQVVVMGRNIVFGNDESKTEQIASLVSDYALSNSECQISHPYSPQSELVCEYPLGKNLVSYVFFDKRTFVGAGDTICLYDGEKRKIGSFTGNELAGKRIQVKSNILKVLLKSDNDEHQGWGFAISKIERIPVSLLRLPFDAIQKTKALQ